MHTPRNATSSFVCKNAWQKAWTLENVKQVTKKDKILV